MKAMYFCTAKTTISYVGVMVAFVVKHGHDAVASNVLEYRQCTSY